VVGEPAVAPDGAHERPSEPASAGKRFVLGRRPGLDGVRAIAIAAVIAFHFGFRRVGGGYLGVDVFFVLSGFLITSLLVQERTNTGRISLKAFYARRARRLLPALYILLIAMSVYAVIRPHQIENLTMRRDVLGALFYVTNWVNAAVGSQPLRMLSHTWSLAIEEQFYLLWPAVVVFLMWRRSPRWLVIAVAAGGVLASAAARAFLLHRYGINPRLNQGLDTRGAGGLLTGCTFGLLVAWDYIPAVVRRFAGLGAIVGAAFLLYAFVGHRYAFAATPAVFRDGQPLVDLATALMILGVIYQPTTPMVRLLSLPPMVWIGRVSYGLYLWHVPVAHVFRPAGINLKGFSLNELRVVWLVVTLVIVTVSFYVIEQPILQGKHTPFRRRAPRPAPAST
jgi:peptidoglycan/LPS O-acetylase OafA/YrhL